ncbi:MAG: alpha/beta fold hydrolase [Ilumatobacteraceae bacterium]|nr:alpha/beta fold hydrolase [Ilumatobacteraceae bacterium]
MRTVVAIGVMAAIAVAACSPAAPEIESADAISDPGFADVSGEPPPASLDESPESGSSELAWSACDDVALLSIVDFECATLDVPLDYDDPDGEQIDIAVVRVPAGDADERIGSLVFNPGGPGGSGIEFLQNAAPIVPAEVADRFDLVSFDPRGVGASTAVSCAVDFDDEVMLLAEGDDAGWAELVADAESAGEDCTPGTLDLAPWVGTNNAARDLDVLRAALGDDQLTYVGFSYGTRLGATYAELFPDRVRALVLDGGVLPTSDETLLAEGQAGGFDLALERFAAACDADADCSLDDVGPTLDVYTDLVADIAEVGGYDTSDPARTLSPGELQLGVAAALYSQQTWPILAMALRDAAVDRDGSLLQVLADGLTGRQPDGSYDNSQVANGFITCADDPARPPADDVRDAADSAASASEYFDDFLRASTGCLGVEPAIDPLRVGAAEGAAPILVIGTTGDPATPYEWSVALAESLSSGRLFTVEGDGHTAYLSLPCVEPAVNDYLIDLELPDDGASCRDDAQGDVFAPAGSSEFELIVALFGCLRDNGADVPDIDLADLLADPSGSELFAGFDPTDPDTGAALLACEDIVRQL